MSSFKGSLTVKKRVTYRWNSADGQNVKVSVTGGSSAVLNQTNPSAKLKLSDGSGDYEADASLTKANDIFTLNYSIRFDMQQGEFITYCGTLVSWQNT
jgi:hypothetical protein